MERINELQAKALVVEMLMHFDKICIDNNLRYSIAYGTMIGCIRHKGFIPWDDDVDVLMPREDYEKLLKMKYKNGKFEVRSCRYSKDYFYPFAKMIDTRTVIKEPNRCEKEMGLFIDIFPMDYIPEEKFMSRFIKKSKKRSDFLLSLGMSRDSSNKNANIIKKLLRSTFYYAILPFKRRLLMVEEKKYIKYNGTDSNLLMCQFWKVSEKTCFSDEIWNNIIRMPFENIEVSIFSDYDKMLRCIYGDYMQLPPVEQRVSPHQLKVWLKD